MRLDIPGPWQVTQDDLDVLVGLNLTLSGSLTASIGALNIDVAVQREVKVLSARVGEDGAHLIVWDPKVGETPP